MKTIQYRVTFAVGPPILVTVTTRNINSGFAKAILSILDTHGDEELNKIEFWQVKD